MFGKQAGMFSGTGTLFDDVEEGKQEEEEEEGKEGGDSKRSDFEASIRSTRSGEEMSHDSHVTRT